MTLEAECAQLTWNQHTNNDSTLIMTQNQIFLKVFSVNAKVTGKEKIPSDPFKSTGLLIKRLTVLVLKIPDLLFSLLKSMTNNNSNGKIASGTINHNK